MTINRMLIAGLVPTFSLGADADAAPKTDTRPNIIFLMEDQARWDALGCINPQMLTPTIAGLVRDGIRFGQAVCQAPMSVASRNSMMLGLYPNQIGILRNEPGLPDDKLPSVPIAEALRRSGYMTAGFGKTHWGLVTDTRGFEVRYEAECRERGAVMMADTDPEKYKRYNEEVAGFGPGEENNEGYIGMTSRLQENEHRDGWITEKCLDFLQNYTPDGRPLFLWLSFFKPHAGNNIPERFEKMYDPDTIRYALQPPWDEECSPHAEGINRRQMYESFWKAATPQQWRLMTMRYYANCTWLDDMFGRVLSRLKDKGLLENAIIIFLSDHGEMLGERYYRFNKYCLYESSVRVPIVMAGSALPESLRGKVDQRPAELTDIYPTLLEIAKIPVPSLLPGKSLLGKEQHEANFCGLHERKDEAAFMWRTDKYKLILCFKRKPDAPAYTRDDIIGGEFYDLRADRQEWNNLYGQPSCQKLQEEMTASLLAKLSTLGRMSPGSVIPAMTR